MTALLSAREVCQRLREAALGVRVFNLHPVPGEAGLVKVDIEGWCLLLDVEGGRLHHCEHCRCPDGREWRFNARYGTDPVNLLSTWELAQIEHLLRQNRLETN
ncbi:DUF7693 family protein [Pseudomonas sp. Eth.TT006]